jgi:hypothetical protein
VPCQLDCPLVAVAEHRAGFVVFATVFVHAEDIIVSEGALFEFLAVIV